MLLFTTGIRISEIVIQIPLVCYWITKQSNMTVSHVVVVVWEVLLVLHTSVSMKFSGCRIQFPTEVTSMELLTVMIEPKNILNNKYDLFFQ